MFASMEAPNFRYYVLTAIISITGMWMQIVGLIWLMLKLTGSPAAAGVARTIGPAVAGIAIATGGLQLCFGLIPFTFVPLIIVLALMRRDRLVDVRRVPRASGQIRAALRHAWGNLSIRLPLLYLLVIG